jgi:YebC/PmpR family DNA-binding regulatory protein
MAGHSKWKNIRARKGKQDTVRGKIFTKLIRELTVAARQGADIDSNSRLRLAVDKALGQNMPRDTIDRAIKRGAGGAEGNNLDEVRYEGYGPGGVAIIVNCLSDNRNRTVGEVRHAFAKHGGNLGTDGSVSYLFKQCGLFCFAPGTDENKVMEVALEAGADDVVANDDHSIDVTTSVEAFTAVKEAMERAKLSPEMAEISFIASMQIPLDKESSEKLINLTEALEELDDVQSVYTNADMAID